ncbi:MAG: ABC transporter substrate-binding protein [Betaproteobacteria bacterium]|nr:ABC transporter substrate-binding protein [Betaproteobacteria bacterium]
MQRFRILLLAPLVMLATIALSAAAQDRKLRIGVEGAYPPFSQVGADGKVAGFDIDIAHALCAELKARCTLVTQEFDGMIPSLIARKFDAVIASMSITEERKKAVDFTDKYYQSPNRMIAKVGVFADATPATLKGKRIGVQRTTIHDRFATDTFKDGTIVRYAKQSEVFLDLAAGRIDAALMDAVPADTGFLKKPAGKGFGFVGAAFNDPKYFGHGAGIAVRKGDTLREELNRALANIRGNGTYKKIQDKYFEFDIYGAVVK